jgi:hypothetical protein
MVSNRAVMDDNPGQIDCVASDRYQPGDLHLGLNAKTSEGRGVLRITNNAAVFAAIASIADQRMRGHLHGLRDTAIHRNAHTGDEA